MENYGHNVEASPDYMRFVYCRSKPGCFRRSSIGHRQWLFYDR